MNTLDIRSLLQDDAIEHVEMSEASEETVKEADEKSDLSQNEEEEVRWRHCKNNNYIDIKSVKEVCNQ